MKITCPNCGKDFDVALRGKELSNYRISMGLKYDGEVLDATTIGKAISNFAGLIKEVSRESAKQAGRKDTTYIAFEGIDQTKGETIIHFLILDKKP